MDNRTLAEREAAVVGAVLTPVVAAAGWHAAKAIASTGGSGKPASTPPRAPDGHSRPPK